MTISESFGAFRLPTMAMGNCRQLVLAAGLSLASFGAAHAATFMVTEGTGQNRPLVAGSIDLGDAPSGGAGFQLGTFGSEDTLGIYGRIVSATDRFTYTFNATEGFNVAFDFDGYALENGGSVDAGYSGLINQNVVNGGDLSSGGKGVTISLLSVALNSIIATRDFVTNVTSLTTASAGIFSGIAAGKYRLIVDGSGGPNTGTAALYDILITAVPIPAALPLLASAFGLARIARLEKASKRDSSRGLN